ncbi:aldo/keto reductase [Asanoa iriomotensis]|nr:aldo/keto reductase [Asanoa iriomotensis]
MRADEMVPLGRTGLRVSRLGLGLASIGGLFTPVSDADAAATIEQAWDLGVRLFDTAPVYGYGRSETRAGHALHDRDRDGYVLATKVGRLIEPGGPDTQPIWADPPPGVGPRLDYTRPAVRRSLAESLDRMDLPRAHVLHVHDPDLDAATALAEAYPELVALRDSGVIDAVSIGSNHADAAAAFVRAAPALDCVLIAGRYTLLDQSALHELLPLCAARGIAVLAAGVFQGGLLTAPGERSAALRAVCARHDVPLLAAAIQFPFGHPAVTSVLVGARSPAEVRESVALLRHPVPPALWADLKESGLVAAP